MNVPASVCTNHPQFIYFEQRQAKGIKFLPIFGSATTPSYMSDAAFCASFFCAIRRVGDLEKSQTGSQSLAGKKLDHRDIPKWTREISGQGKSIMQKEKIS